MNGRYKSVQGYIYILSPNHPYKDCRGYVKKERLILEKKLGRYLKPKEVVHHVNGIKGDNRKENLMLFKSNSEHRKFELRENGHPFEGKTHTKEVRKMIAESNRKRKVSKATKLKMSISGQKAWDEGKHAYHTFI